MHFLSPDKMKEPPTSPIRRNGSVVQWSCGCLWILFPKFDKSCRTMTSTLPAKELIEPDGKELLIFYYIHIHSDIMQK